MAPWRWPSDHKRIDNAPEVVDGGVAEDAQGAGGPLDLDLAHVAAVGKGHGARHVMNLTVEAERLGFRPQRRIEGGPRNLGESDRTVSTGDAVVPLLEVDVLRARLQQSGSHGVPLLDRLPRRATDGVTADREAARAVAAAAVRDEVGIPLLHADAAEGNAERVGNDLREDDFVPLPARLAADQDDCRALGIEAQCHPLVSVATAGIDIEREPDTAQIRPLFRPALPRRAPAAFLTHFLKNSGKVAGIVDLSEGRPVRHGVVVNEVATAHLDRVEAHFVRRLVDQALQQIDVLRPAGTAISVGRCHVGVGSAHADMERRRQVRSDERAGAAGGRDEGSEIGGIGAEVGDALHPKREKASVGVERRSRPGGRSPSLHRAPPPT